MFACVDVDYQSDRVTAAAVGFMTWTDAVGSIELVLRSFESAAPYEPGAFATRELPYILRLVERLPAIDAIVVDAYVWLGPDRPGLGKRLHDATGLAVIGVAKTRFESAEARDIVRGDSARPLHVTAIGIDLDNASAAIASMHGDHRIPTLLKRADSLARGV